MSPQTHGLTQPAFLTHYQLPVFVGLAIALSATIATFAAISGNKEMAILIVLTPSLLAIGLTATVSGKVGLTDLLVKRLWGHARWPWLVLAIGLIPAIAYLTLFIRSFLGGPPASLRTTQLLPQLIIIGVIALGEEFGWRGYALPRLQQRYSALMASLILGFVWGFWHFPGYLIGVGVPLAMPLLVFLLWVILITILMTWVYTRTQSILLAIIMHAAANATFNYLPLLPEFTGQMGSFLLFLGLLGLVVTAVVLGAGMHKRLR
jgi:membrane protease YdiL (CAAX protease family)